MQLIAAQIKKYKCIDDSTRFWVEPDITCLVGKNESGKSALLEALYRVNPLPVGLPTEFDGLRDYPRRSYATDQATVSDVTVVATTFELSVEEVRDFERHFGAGALLATTVSFHRTYANRMLVGLDLDEAVVFRHVKAQAAFVGLGLQDATTVDELKEAIDAVADPPDTLSTLRKRLDIGLAQQARIWLFQRLPRMLLFTQYSTLPGTVSINRLQTADENDLEPHERTALALLRLAGVATETFDVANYELRRARLEAAASRITEEVLRYWSQNEDLQVELDIDFVPRLLADEPEPFLRIRIRDNRQRVTIDFSERSVGFVWFFSFLTCFAELRDRAGHHVVLLDEPGLNLHATAQDDLLRFIEEQVAGSHQVVYSTHSPFMVPSDRLERVRLVEDDRRSGTVVHDGLSGAVDGTQIPIAAAIGVSAARRPAGRGRTLIVDGTADATFLQVVGAHLTSLRRPGLSDEWVPAPVGGLDSIPLFLAALDQQRPPAVVVGSSPPVRKRMAELLERGLLAPTRQLDLLAYATTARYADVEDMFDVDWYLELLARCGVARLSSSRLTGRDPRIVRRVEHTIGHRYSRYSPAGYLARHPEMLNSASAGALNRFEALFVDVDELL